MGALAGLSALALGTTQSTGSSGSTPGEPPATLVWPLGLDGQRPRVLYNTQGQWVTTEEKPYRHSGIDIGASPGELVFAVEGGTVVTVSIGEGDDDQGGYLIVSRGEDAGHGIKYMHLASSTVDVGAEVQRDQLLGTVVEWSASCGFDHLHLQVVQSNCSASEGDLPWKSGCAGDAGNPLLLLGPRSDDQPPTLEPQTSEDGESVTLLFLDEETGKEVHPGEIAGPVDVVARVSERFPGAEPVPFDGECVVPPADVLAPLRLELRVVVTGTPLPDAAPEDQRPYGSTEYVHVLDYTGPVSAAGGEAEGGYLPVSTGTYTERDLRFVLTHDPESNAGAWSPESSGPYRVELVVTDASHNVTSYATDVTVALP